MPDYVVGVDLGTTYTAAAVLRDGRVDVVELGDRVASVASVLWFRDDHGVVVGEAAVRRAESDPGRVAREFKRRFGDPVPIMVAGTPMSADALTARLVSEPVVVAESHATAAQVAAGAVVGVYDLGGGTFDAAVLRRTPIRRRCPRSRCPGPGHPRSRRPRSAAQWPGLMRRV